MTSARIEPPTTVLAFAVPNALPMPPIVSAIPAAKRPMMPPAIPRMSAAMRSPRCCDGRGSDRTVGTETAAAVGRLASAADQIQRSQLLGYAGPGDPGIDRIGLTPDWRALARQAIAKLKHSV
jgi:hypothetical protein